MKPQLLALLLTTSALTAGAADTLRIMTYNVHSGFPMGTSSKNYSVTEHDFQNIADVITSSSADLVALQEMQCEWGLASQTTHTTNYLNEPRLLAAQTRMHYAYGSAIEDHDYPTTNQEYLEWGEADRWQNNATKHGEYGNAVLARHGFQTIPQSFGLPALPEKEPRQFLRIEPKIPGYTGKVVLFATHLAHDSAPSRMEQMRVLLDRAAAEPKDNIVFIAGDLNYVPGSPGKLIDMAKERGFHDLHEAFAKAHGAEPQFTIPADKPDRRIDYILCNRQLKVRNAEVISTQASDHLPLFIEVELE
jgi:endonuclease/exonuclease/phosphatase family metal-dependent hydrolase